MFTLDTCADSLRIATHPRTRRWRRSARSTSACTSRSRSTGRTTRRSSRSRWTRTGKSSSRSASRHVRLSRRTDTDLISLQQDEELARRHVWPQAPRTGVIALALIDRASPSTGGRPRCRKPPLYTLAMRQQTPLSSRPFHERIEVSVCFVVHIRLVLRRQYAQSDLALFVVTPPALARPVSVAHPTFHTTLASQSFERKTLLLRRRVSRRRRRACGGQCEGRKARMGSRGRQTSVLRRSFIHSVMSSRGAGDGVERGNRKRDVPCAG